MKYKITLKTLNIPVDSGGMRLTKHEHVINCMDGFEACCGAMGFAMQLDSAHRDGKQIIQSLKEHVRKEAMSVSETSLRNTGNLHIEHPLYVFDIVPVVEDSVL